MFCLRSKDGCSLYTYSLHILYQIIRLISQLPAAIDCLQNLLTDFDSLLLVDRVASYYLIEYLATS